MDVGVSAQRMKPPKQPITCPSPELEVEVVEGGGFEVGGWGSEVVGSILECILEETGLVGGNTSGDVGSVDGGDDAGGDGGLFSVIVMID